MFKRSFALILSVCAFMSVAEAEIFHWKLGQSGAGDYSDPANWDVGSVGAENPQKLIPGADDEICGVHHASWNFGGGTYTIGTWDSVSGHDESSDWNRYYYELSAGELKVMSRTSHTDTIAINDGASLIFPEGSFYAPSVSCSAPEQLILMQGAHLSILGEFAPYRVTLSTRRYGTALINPKTFRIHAGSAQPSVVDNAGTNIFPNGLVWTGGGTANCSLTINLKWSGRLLAAGEFNRNGHPGRFDLFVDGGGSVIESIGDLSFGGMDECHVSGGMTFTANEGHTIDASNFTYYKNAYKDDDTPIVSYKLGHGTLAIGSDLPPRLQVNAGTIAVKGARSDLDGMVFIGGSVTVRYDVVGCRLDRLENESDLNRVTFKNGIDLNGLTSGACLFSSADDSIRAAMKSEMEKDLPEGMQIGDDGDSLFLVSESGYRFDASKSADLSDMSAWNCETLPTNMEVSVCGSGTVLLNASSPSFAKINVSEGCVLRIEGGEESNPIVPPPLAMSYKAKILCAGGSHVKLTNEIECIALPTLLPVFEIATNAVVYAESPNHETAGFMFKNMHLNYFGTIKLPDAFNKETPCITFGHADNEVSYFGMNIDGGRLEVVNRAVYWQGNVSLVRIMCPDNGGAVHPVGALNVRNFVKAPDSYTDGGTVILANSGYHIGVGNPDDIAFTLNVSGTPLGLNGTSMFAGGADIVCTGADSGLVKGDLFINFTLTQQVNVEGCARITLKDGARFSNAFCVGSRGKVYFSPSDSSASSLVYDGGASELYEFDGGRKAKVIVKNGCYDIGRLLPESVTAPETGWEGARYSNVFNRFAQIEIQGVLQVRGTDAFPRPDWWNFDGCWDHEVQFTDMPVRGTGSIVVTNTTAGNSMTLTMVNRGNLATGTISAAPGTRSKLLFKDDANWSGTVIANGCAGLVNTDAETGAEKAAFVKFKDMRMDGEFPIRVWSTDAYRTNDFIEISGAVTGSDGGFFGVPMDGRSPKSGDSYRIATYPASSQLPVNNVPRWRLSSVPHGSDASKVVLVLTYQPPGTTIVLR